jgi:hypothetical protein
MWVKALGGVLAATVLIGPTMCVSALSSDPTVPGAVVLAIPDGVGPPGSETEGRGSVDEGRAEERGLEPDGTGKGRSSRTASPAPAPPPCPAEDDGDEIDDADDDCDDGPEADDFEDDGDDGD